MKLGWEIAKKRVVGGGFAAKSCNLEVWCL